MKVALYTTVYPGVEPFLADWLHSVRQQTDRDFQLWIGSDTLSVETVIEAMGSDPSACWITSQPGESPVQLRQRSWQQILPAHDAIVMVDSDDLLLPSRVETARSALLQCDLAGCALRLVDEQGGALNKVFGAPTAAQAVDMLPRHNVFGLSNTAYRTDLLRRCLPLPLDLVIADWYLATLAWLQGARLDFDPVTRMDYRQHSDNLTQIQGPFTARRVLRDTTYVRHHFRFLSALPPRNHLPERLANLGRIAEDVDRFYRQVACEPDSLERYINALNALDLALAWWICVAHPALADMWRREGT